MLMLPDDFPPSRVAHRVSSPPAGCDPWKRWRPGVVDGGKVLARMGWAAVGFDEGDDDDDDREMRDARCEMGIAARVWLRTTMVTNYGY